MVEFVDEYDDKFNTAFLENLNRGELCPNSRQFLFVHSAYQMFEKWNIDCCRTHIIQILTDINSTMARVKPACVAMSNILLEAFVLDKNDNKRSLVV